MFEIEYVIDLQWNNAEHTSFTCVVKYAGFAEAVPAGINGQDTTEHIREIWTNGNAGVYGTIAEYVPPVATAGQNKTEAKNLLAATDWVNEPDVYDPANNPHLTNRSEFITYRDAIRPIAVNPVAGNLNWPVKPTEVWSN